MSPTLELSKREETQQALHQNGVSGSLKSFC